MSEAWLNHAAAAAVDIEAARTVTAKALEHLQDVLHILDRAIEALETSEEPPW
jgi:predicted house-cleaning noncanonical NTP pyrophosphatase (MazG superfamily)